MTQTGISEKEVFKRFKDELKLTAENATIMLFFSKYKIDINDKMYKDKSSCIYPLEYALTGKKNKLSKIFINNGADISKFVNLVVQNSEILDFCLSQKRTRSVLMEKQNDIIAYYKNHVSSSSSARTILVILLKNNIDVNYKPNTILQMVRNNNLVGFKKMYRIDRTYTDVELLNAIIYNNSYNIFEWFIGKINITTNISEYIQTLPDEYKQVYLRKIKAFK
jgi:hypothetical protein